MGIGPHWTVCGIPRPSQEVEIVYKEVRVPAPGNPNPNRFRILRTWSWSDRVIAEVEYPDCKNYEGRKVMLFVGTTEADVRSQSALDPHFCEDGHLSPFARFEPTTHGWDAAKTLAFALPKVEK